MHKLAPKFSGGLRSLAKYQGGWVQIILFIVSLIISIVLAPKPASPRAAALEDFDVPLAEEDRPIPVLFGTKRITGANVVWHGDLSVQPIKKSSTLGGSQIVGHKYFLGMHMAFCHAFDKVTKIEAGDKEAWSGTVTSNTSVLINQPGLFGGEKREGGLVGYVDFMFGADTQVANTYLAAKLAGPMPAFRGVAGCVFRGSNFAGLILPAALGGKGSGGYVGTSPYVKPWAITGTRILSGWQNGVAWYPETAAIGDAMNAIHIVYQALTDGEWGQGTPAAMIDDANFRDMADTIFDEGLGLNMLWNQTTKIEDFIQIVMDHIAGILAFDVMTGKYTIKLIRGDYNPDTLQTFDPSNARSMTNFQRRSWGETVNELTIAYTDPVAHKATEIIVQDLGNIRAQQERIPEKIDRQGIADKELIKVVAGRELASRSTPLARADMTVNRVGWDKGPGDVIKARWPAYKLETTVMRIINMRKGNLERGTITVSLVEDIYALSGLEYADVPTPEGAPTPPVNPTDPPANGGTVMGTTLTSPPLSNVMDGDRYLVAAPATGLWAGHEGEIAEWDDGNDEWIFMGVPPGTIVYDEDTGTHVTVQYGEAVPTPWTPAIPPLIEDEEPELGDLFLVAYDTSTANSYVKVRADQVGSGAGSIVNAGINLSMFHPGIPTSSKLLFQYTVPDNWMLPGNLVDSVGHIGTNPTASFVMNVANNGSSIGSITVSTAGAFTFTTTSGNPVALVAGDKLTIVAPSSADATAADISTTLVTYTEILEAGRPNKISFGLFFPGTPASNQLIAKTIIARAVTFPANFSTSFGDVGTNPTGSFVVTVVLNGANVGTITISTGGAFTFASTGGVDIIAQAGDVLELEAPSATDATVANIGVTLVATLP